MIRKLMHAMRDSQRASRQRRELRELRALDPRIRRDIGVTDEDISREMRRLGTWI